MNLGRQQLVPGYEEAQQPFSSVHSAGMQFDTNRWYPAAKGLHDKNTKREAEKYLPKRKRPQVTGERGRRAHDEREQRQPCYRAQHHDNRPYAQEPIRGEPNRSIPSNSNSPGVRRKACADKPGKKGDEPANRELRNSLSNNGSR